MNPAPCRAHSNPPHRLAFLRADKRRASRDADQAAVIEY